MRARLVLMLVGIGVSWVAPAVRAQVPLENPPFVNGGFVATSRDELAAQNASGAIVTKYTSAVTRCDQKLVRALEKAYAGASPSKIADADAKWNDCTAKANARFADAVSKQVATGRNPLCLSTSDIGAIKGQVDALLAVNNPVVYCDATQGTDPGSGFAVPADKEKVLGETAVSAAAVKAGGAVAKCFAKAAVADFEGTIDQAKHDACVARAQDRALGVVQKFSDKALLPSCLPLAVAQGIVSIGVAAGSDFTDETYCYLSPSGAFLDGGAPF